MQGNEPPWILNNLDFYKKVYQNDIDYRKNQIVVVLILMSPLILEATPELLAALQDQAALANEALTDVGTYLQYKLEVEGVDAVITANELRAKVSEIVVRVLSKYNLAKYSTLKNILNSGRNYKSASELFKSAKKTYDNFKQIKKFFGF